MRMEGNLWTQLWQKAPVMAAEDQKALMDHVREGEKVIHYLVTIHPGDLLTQMLCTAYTSADDVLARCEGAMLQPVVEERRVFSRRSETMRDATGDRWLRKGGRADSCLRVHRSVLYTLYSILRTPYSLNIFQWPTEAGPRGFYAIRCQLLF